MSYKCNSDFKSSSGKDYKKGSLITFEEYYQMTANERKYFTYIANIRYEFNSDKIR